MALRSHTRSLRPLHGRAKLAIGASGGRVQALVEGCRLLAGILKNAMGGVWGAGAVLFVARSVVAPDEGPGTWRRGFPPAQASQCR